MKSKRGLLDFMEAAVQSLRLALQSGTVEERLSSWVVVTKYAVLYENEHDGLLRALLSGIYDEGWEDGRGDCLDEREAE